MYPLSLTLCLLSRYTVPVLPREKGWGVVSHCQHPKFFTRWVWNWQWHFFSISPGFIWDYLCVFSNKILHLTFSWQVYRSMLQVKLLWYTLCVLDAWFLFILLPLKATLCRSLLFKWLLVRFSVFPESSNGILCPFYCHAMPPFPLPCTASFIPPFKGQHCAP